MNESSKEREVGLKLGEIMVDESLRTRPIDYDWVRQLNESREVGDRIEPMTVTMYGGRYVLVDGHNRYEMYKRAWGSGWEEATVTVRVIECRDTNDILRAAIDGNRKHGKPLTEQQRRRLYYRLTREMGWSRKEAEQAIGITHDHGEQYESRLVSMPATERASGGETPIGAERVTEQEKPVPGERVTSKETPNHQERATLSEQPSLGERASTSESTIGRERANYKQIEFHTRRLREHIPADWIASRRALAALEDAVIKDMKEHADE